MVRRMVKKHCLIIILNLFFLFHLESIDINKDQKYTSIPDKFKRPLYGFIDKKGNLIIKPKFNVACDFSEGLAAVRKYNKKYFGYINKKGKYVIKPKFNLAMSFSEGLAAVMIKDKWGYINKEGKVVIEPKFDTGYYYNLYYFSEGLAAVQFNGKWGYINKEGNWIVKPQFIEAYPFSEGLARVKVVIKNK